MFCFCANTRKPPLEMVLQELRALPRSHVARQITGVTHLLASRLQRTSKLIPDQMVLTLELHLNRRTASENIESVPCTGFPLHGSGLAPENLQPQHDSRRT